MTSLFAINDDEVNSSGKAELQLPTYEEMTGIKDSDSSRLPTCKTRPVRYFPYRHATSCSHPKLAEELHPEDRLFNTFCDEEYVRLDVPTIGVEVPHDDSPAIDEDVVSGQLENANYDGHDAALDIPLVATPELENLASINQDHEVDPQDLAYALEDVQAFDRRVQHIAAIILTEFIVGLNRAHADYE